MLKEKIKKMLSLFLLYRKMQYLLLLLVIVVTKPIASEPRKYRPDWKDLDSRPLPQWYDEAKFGIFVHWGIYSVPAIINEWFWFKWDSE